MKLLRPVEINYNTIRHYICHLLAHPLLYLLCIHNFIRATHPVSCQELLSLVSRQSDSGYGNLPNAPTSRPQGCSDCLPGLVFSKKLALPPLATGPLSPPHHTPSLSSVPSQHSNQAPNALSRPQFSPQSTSQLQPDVMDQGCPPPRIHMLIYKPLGEFLGSPVVRTPCFYCP